MTKIQIGEVTMNTTDKRPILANKTRKYLLPCLKEYGTDFTSRLDSVYKVAVGIGDIIVSNRGIKHEKHIFILINSTIATEFFLNFLDWIREQDMYEDDYIFGNILTSILHMVIIKLPVKYYSSFETFKLGSYSEMYDKEDVDILFKGKLQYKKVIIKDHNYKVRFVEILNEQFGTSLVPEEYEGELDFPPDKEEIFNNHIKKTT